MFGRVRRRDELPCHVDAPVGAHPVIEQALLESPCAPTRIDTDVDVLGRGLARGFLNRGQQCGSSSPTMGLATSKGLNVTPSGSQPPKVSIAPVPMSSDPPVSPGGGGGGGCACAVAHEASSSAPTTADTRNTRTVNRLWQRECRIRCPPGPPALPSSRRPAARRRPAAHQGPAPDPLQPADRRDGSRGECDS